MFVGFALMALLQTGQLLPEQAGRDGAEIVTFEEVATLESSVETTLITVVPGELGEV